MLEFQLGRGSEKKEQGERVNKHYTNCPDCHAKMRRTGKKQKQGTTSSPPLYRRQYLYLREYECPSCGKFWLHNEMKRIFSRGQLRGTLEKKE